LRALAENCNHLPPLCDGARQAVDHLHTGPRAPT
jgi:hypothetical protein